MGGRMRRTKGNGGGAAPSRKMLICRHITEKSLLQNIDFHTAGVKDNIGRPRPAACFNLPIMECNKGNCLPTWTWGGHRDSAPLAAK